MLQAGTVRITGANKTSTRDARHVRRSQGGNGGVTRAQDGHVTLMVKRKQKRGKGLG